MVRVLPDPEQVAHQHRRMLEYCQQADPLFIVRALTSTERGQIYRTASGSRFVPSDNSPAWWMHFVTFNGIADARFEDVPTHMFQVGRLLQPNINTAGWHVAHIYNAKDRQTGWQKWTRDELVRRFIRNIHPCNCFYVPKTEWTRYGGDERVIRFIAGRYAERYRNLWSEFVAAARGEPLAGNDGSLRYVYPLEPAVVAHPVAASTAARSVASYRFSRLCFRADVIEPLRDDDVFEVITPVGRFRLTKGEFYRAFPSVVASKSYRERRIYHYPKVPAVALRYRCSDDPSASRAAK